MNVGGAANVNVGGAANVNVGVSRCECGGQPM